MTRKLYTGVYQRGKLPIQTNGWPVATTFNHGCAAVRFRRVIYGFQAKAGNAVFRVMEIWIC
jgi:hypothetical protein